MRIGLVILTLILVSIVGIYSWRHFCPSTDPAVALELEDPRLRESALRQLGGIGDKFALEPLITALKDKDARVRKAAALALQEVLPTVGDPEAVTQAIEALGSTMNDAEVRPAALGALNTISQVGLEPLLLALKDEDHKMRSAVAVSLQFVLPAVDDPQRRAQAIEPLILAMKDEEFEVRRYAPIALAKIGKPALEPLLRVILEEDCGERCCDDACCLAALAIREILQDRDDGELNRRIVLPLVDRILDAKQSHDKRANAAYGLSQILVSRFGDPASRETADSALITALKDPSQEVRAEAATALNRVHAGRKDPDITGRSVAALLTALQDDSPSVRERVAYALGTVVSAIEEHDDQQNAVESLVLRLNDPDERDSVHEAVASALSWIGTKEAREAVRNAGFDPDRPPTPRVVLH